MNKKKIILLIDSLVAGGAQRQMVLLAQQLKNSSYEPIILVYHDHMDLRSCVEYYDIELKVILKDRLGWIKLCFSIIEYLKAQNPYAIISYLHTPNQIARIAGRLAGVNRIVTSQRNLDILHSKKRILAEKITQNLSSFVITNSNANRKLITREFGFDSSRLLTIYNGVDTEIFSPINNDVRWVLRECWGANENDTVFLLPGRIVEQKNHIGLLDAVSKLDKNSAFKIVFVGHEFDQNIRKKLDDQIRTYGLEQSIVFAGLRSDMPEVYAAVDVLVLPSLWEGLPNVVIEAMACAKPVIVTDVSDNNIIVSDDVGSVLAVGDTDALAQMLHTYCHKGAECLAEMGRAGRQRIQKICSLNAFKEQYVNLLDNLA